MRLFQIEEALKKFIPVNQKCSGNNSLKKNEGKYKKQIQNTYTAFTLYKFA